MKVAIVHYWLVGMRGGERVLEEICKLYPQADIYTHVVERESLSSHLLQHEIYETFIGKLPFATRHYQKYLPLMPYALENLDLTGYDLVISSEAGPAKGVITSPEALHVCYCHSPMRYIWDQYHEYAKEKGIIQKLTYPILTHKMRIWDAASASRPDHIIANSRFVAQRIKKFWGRGSDVIHPPVDFEAFQDSNNSPDDFYLVAGELVPYKNVGIVIRAFNALQKRLIVIGDGPERSTLEKQAEPNISF